MGRSTEACQYNGLLCATTTQKLREFREHQGQMTAEEAKAYMLHRVQKAGELKNGGRDAAEVRDEYLVEPAQVFQPKRLRLGP